jgi:transketolase
VLPPGVTRRVAVEAGVTMPWWQYVGLQGEIVGIDHFGASAPAKDCSRPTGSRRSTWARRSKVGVLAE